MMPLAISPAVVTARPSVEVLRFQPETSRAQEWLRAMTAAAPAAGLALTSTSQYGGQRSWLAIWGPGAPNRFEPMRQQLAAGGHVLCFDLAYWHRDQKVRVSIDAAHPQQWVMREDWPSSRWRTDPARVDNQWKPNGPIIIAGIGRKARVQYGEETVLAWETAMADQCRAQWPGRTIYYRPKQADGPRVANLPVSSSPSIDAALAGTSLVITWHSNVAVDAIRLGIPVVCRDGAAAAVCPAELPDDPRPVPVPIRDRFLANLAWFQWAPSEASAMWRWLQTVLT